MMISAIALAVLRARDASLNWGLFCLLSTESVNVSSLRDCAAS